MKDKDTFFFPHDFGARNDPKLQNVLMEHGCEGLGVFWCIVEQIYEQGGVLPLSSCKTIAFALHVDCNVVQSVVSDFELFKNDSENFWSDSINARLKKRAKIAEKRKQAALKRWNPKGESKSNANALQDYAIKGKERKGKESNILSKDSVETKVSSASAKKVDYSAIVDLFHSKCPSFPKILKISEARKQKVKARLDEMGGDIQKLESVFVEMEKSKFLRGDNSNGWKATFDWVFQNSNNWMKIIEGNFSDSKKYSKPKGGDNSNDVNNIWQQ